MKNTTIKYILIVLGIAVVVTAFVLSKKISPTAQAPDASTPVASPASKAPLKTATIQTSPAAKAAKPVTYPTATNYVDYITALKAREEACRTAASNQYDRLYKAALQASSYKDYSVASNGGCFMQVIGKIQPAYSASVTGHIYFRNVTQNTLLAECTDPTGTMLADSNWSCINKMNGQTMTKAEFNGFVNSFISK